MTARDLRIGLTFALIAVFSVISLVAEDLVVTVDGEAGGTGAAAKGRAVEDALRNAVEKGFGVYIDSVTLSESAVLISDDITARTKGFVRSWELLEEKEMGNAFKVKVRAVVSLDKVWESDSLGLLLRRMEAPRFTVTSNEKVDATEVALNGTPAGDKMISELTGRGFHLVGPQAPRGESGVQYGILIDANAVYDHDYEVDGLRLYYFNAVTEARAIQADTGKIIAASTGKALRGARLAEEALHDALSFSSAEASDQLVRGILAAWVESLNTGRFVRLVIRGIGASRLADVIDEIKSVAGVQEVAHLGYSGGNAELSVKTRLKSIELSAELERNPGLGLKVQSITPNGIEAKAMR